MAPNCHHLLLGEWSSPHWAALVLVVIPLLLWMQSKRMRRTIARAAKGMELTYCPTPNRLQLVEFGELCGVQAGHSHYVKDVMTGDTPRGPLVVCRRVTEYGSRISRRTEETWIALIKTETPSRCLLIGRDPDLLSRVLPPRVLIDHSGEQTIFSHPGDGDSIDAQAISEWLSHQAMDRVWQVTPCCITGIGFGEVRVDVVPELVSCTRDLLEILIASGGSAQAPS